MSQSELARALEILVAELERLQVRYAIGGSVASSFHGMPRATMDVDIEAHLEVAHVARFIAALRGHYYAPEEQIRKAIANRSAFNLIDQSTVVKVDVFVRGGEPYDNEAMMRRQRRRLGSDDEPEIWILAPEDVVLRKLCWFRDGNEVSDSQWRDIVGVLQIQGERIDMDYLRSWSGKLGVADLLERALLQGE